MSRGTEHICTRGWLLGRDMDGGLRERLAVPASNVHPLPDAIDASLAPLLQVLATCVHAQRRISIFPGESVVVLGHGVTGLLHVQLAKLRGAHPVIGVTRSAEKLALANTVGAAVAGGADLVIEGAGAVGAFARAMEMVRTGGRILAYGTMTETSGELPFYDLYHKEMTVVGARSARVEDFPAAIEAVASGRVALEPLLSARFPIAEVDHEGEPHQPCLDRDDAARSLRGDRRPHRQARDPLPLVPGLRRGRPASSPPPPRTGGLRRLAARPFATGSQGERQRVLLARALYSEPEPMILDEPASGLDLPSREALIEALETVASGPVAPTTLVATDHLEEIAPSTTDAALLREGGLVASGEIDRVLTTEQPGDARPLGRHVRQCFSSTVTKRSVERTRARSRSPGSYRPRSSSAKSSTSNVPRSSSCAAVLCISGLRSACSYIEYELRSRVGPEGRGWWRQTSRSWAAPS